MGILDILGAGSEPSGKAISQAFTGSDPVMIQGPGTSTRARTPFSQEEAPRHLQAYGGKEDAIDWVMNCVRLIAEISASADWGFEKHGIKYIDPDSRSDKTPDEVLDAPAGLVALFKSPNPYMSYTELVEVTLMDYLLTGNAYWLRWKTNDAGQPLALYRLSPQLVKIVPGRLGVEKYIYSVPGMPDLELTPDQVMHIRMANPHSPYYGMGIIQGGARVLDLELALTETQWKYFENRAQPSMVVQSDRRVPKEVVRRLGQQMRMLYGGPKNAGAMMILEAGLKYQAISPSAQEAMFEELSKMSRDRILAMFRVPASLLGIGDDKSGGAEPNDQQRIFADTMMKPLLKKFQAAVTQGVVRYWDDLEYKVYYEYLIAPEERVKLAANYAAIPGIRVREIRAFLGEEPLGSWHDDLILNLPGTEGTADDTNGGHPDFNLGSEPGRPPNPANTRAFPDRPEDLPSTAKASNQSVRKSMTAVASGKSTKDIDLDAVSGRLEAILTMKAIEAESSESQSPKIDFSDLLTVVPDDSLTQTRERAIDKIVAELVRDVNGHLGNLETELLYELDNAVEGKAPGDRIRSKIRNSSAWRKFSEAFTAAIEKATRSSVAVSVVQQAGIDNLPEDEVDYEQVAREIVHRTGGSRRIVQNFKDLMSKKVGNALDTGETKADVSVAIREAIEYWRSGHSETVALTEATHAYNEGVLTVAEGSGYGYVYVHDGDEHDEPCELANGQVWTVEYARANRLEHPRCRRAFTPVRI